MSILWKDAAALLRKAADTIDSRGRLRDAENEPDPTEQFDDEPPTRAGTATLPEKH